MSYAVFTHIRVPWLDVWSSFFLLWLCLCPSGEFFFTQFFHWHALFFYSFLHAACYTDTYTILRGEMLQWVFVTKDVFNNLIERWWRGVRLMEAAVDEWLEDLSSDHKVWGFDSTCLQTEAQWECLCDWVKLYCEGLWQVFKTWSSSNTEHLTWVAEHVCSQHTPLGLAFLLFLCSGSDCDAAPIVGGIERLFRYCPPQINQFEPH